MFRTMFIECQRVAKEEEKNDTAEVQPILWETYICIPYMESTPPNFPA